jgi:hypothetical protein
MAWSRLPLDWSTVAKCGISAADLDEARLAIQERIDQIDAEVGDDDFTNGVIHANRWQVYTTGSAAVEEDGVLKVSLPDTDLSKYADSGVLVRSITRRTWLVSDDFDISVDWSYTPTVNEIPLYLRIDWGSDWKAVIGIIQNSGTVKYIWAGRNKSFSYSSGTSDTSGTFRITRSGTTVTIYTDATQRFTETHADYEGSVHPKIYLETSLARTAGWGGASAEFHDFTIADGTVKWYRQDATDDTLDSISLPDVAAFGEVWPVSAVNAYRSALEAIIPYFFDGVETPTRYTKASLLTAAILATDWTDSPLSALLVPAKRQHLNDLYEACRKAIYLPSDDDVDDNGFDEPSWDYPG